MERLKTQMKESAKDIFRFYNIVPCNIGREKLQAQDVIELEVRTGINIALYSLTLHPEGFPAKKKADLLIESYRKFSRALQGSKVRPGVLLQSILGHWPRVDKNEEKWTRTIDLDGKIYRFCPLDPDFRQYIFDTVAALTKEHPCFILGDDDIRSFSPKADCFCKLHTAERILVELRDKIQKIAPETTFGGGAGPSKVDKAVEDAILALGQLGFQGPKFQKLVADVALEIPEDQRSTENIIRKALQALNR